jgi:hypothetical protein
MTKDSIPDRETDFSLFYGVQTGSGVHLASSPMDIGAYFEGVQRPEREANNSPPYTAYVKNAWNYTSIPFPFTPVHG